MKYLSLDSDNDGDWNSIKAINSPDIDELKWTINGKTFLVFEHRGRRFHVSHNNQIMDSDVVLEFNSNLWRIKEISLPSADSDGA